MLGYPGILIVSRAITSLNAIKALLRGTITSYVVPYQRHKTEKMQRWEENTKYHIKQAQWTSVLPLKWTISVFDFDSIDQLVATFLNGIQIPSSPPQHLTEFRQEDPGHHWVLIKSAHAQFETGPHVWAVIYYRLDNSVYQDVFTYRANGAEPVVLSTHVFHEIIIC